MGLFWVYIGLFWDVYALLSYKDIHGVVGLFLIYIGLFWGLARARAGMTNFFGYN